jgi:hypothetical protein
LAQITLGGVNTYQAQTDPSWQTQLVAELAAVVGVSTSQIQLTNIVIVQPGTAGTIVVTFIIYSSSQSQSASLAGQLGADVQNTSSALYNPNNAIASNADPGAFTSQDPNTYYLPNAASPTSSSGIISGLSPTVGIAIIVVVVVAGAALAFGLGFFCTKTEGGKEFRRRASTMMAPGRGKDLALTSVHTAPVSPVSTNASAGAWTKVFDQQHQAHYYFNSQTQETLWEKPHGVNI